MHDFDSKVVVITGASSGIGKETALQFGKAGAKVVVGSRRLEATEETAQEITSNGGEAIAIQTDVSKQEDIENLMKKAVEEYGGIDYAFNNAGIEGTVYVSTAEYEVEEWDKVMDINLKGVWLCMKYQIPEMLKKGSGAIVNMSSVAGLKGGRIGSAYYASKHAVVGLTKSSALEYAPSGIRINAVCPAVIISEMTERAFFHDKELEKMVIGMHPVGRIGTPDEVATAVLWLCSDEASFVTGHAMPIDGGFMI